MSDPRTNLERFGRGSDSFDGNHRHPETADLEGHPERDLVVDDYDGQTRGAGLLTQPSTRGADPAVAGDAGEHDA